MSAVSVLQINHTCTTNAQLVQDKFHNVRRINARPQLRFGCDRLATPHSCLFLTVRCDQIEGVAHTLNEWTVLVPWTSKMSPPIHSTRQRRGFAKSPKYSDVNGFQIITVEEDNEDEMYCSQLVRRLIMLQPITAAAAVFTGYRYWKLQFAQLLMLQSLGLNMNTRLLFAVIDFIVNSKCTCA